MPVTSSSSTSVKPGRNADRLRGGDRIEFDYRGIYKTIVETVTPADVVWTCRLLSRLSDQQWNDAFVAGGYPPDQAARFIAKLKSKIAQGLALANRS